MAKTGAQIAAELKKAYGYSSKSTSKEGEKIRNLIAAKEAGTHDPSAEKKQNIQYKRELAEAEKMTGDIPAAEEIWNAHQQTLSRWRSDNQKREIQRRKEEAATPKAASLPSGSQIKADTARKQLEMYLASDERKEWARRQQENLQAQALLEGITDGQWQPETDQREQALRDMADYWQGQADAEYDRDVTARNMETIAAMSEEDRAAFEKYVSGGTYTDMEAVEAHKGLKSRYGNLDQLKESWERNRDAELNRQAAEKTAAMLDSNMDRGLAWVPSVAAQIAGGITGSAGRINEMFNGTGQYRSPSEATLGDLPTTIGQTVQEQTTKHILDGQELNLLDGITGRELGALAYQGASSLLNIAGRIALSFGSGGVAAGLAATQTFADSMAEAAKQGATAEQAVILSVGKAGLEAATEKIPLDDLLDIARHGGKGFWTVLKQAFTEITEEELSLFGGLALEAAVLREKSSYKQQIGDAVANGMSYAEAKEQADRGIWNEAAQTAAVSGFSGAVSAAGAKYYNSEIGSTQNTTGQTETSVTAADNAGDAAPLPSPATNTSPEARAAEAQQEQVVQAPPAASVDPIANGMMQDESTSVNTDPAQHTPQEQAVIDEYQNSVDDNLVDYVEAVKNNPGQKMPRYPLKDVSDRAAADIQRLTGIDVTGNKTQIESRMIEHIIKDHGDAGATDRSMRDVNDIARIQYVIDNYDSMEHGGTSSAYVYQNKHGRNANAQTVVIKKKVNGTYFVVEAVPDTKKKTLYIVSAYMSKNGQKETASSLSGDAEASRVTSDNATKIDTVPNISIPENGTEVNGNIDENGAQDADTQGQSPEGGQVKGTGAAERNFSGVAEYENMLYDGNIQRSRPGAVRDVEIPKKDSDGRHVTELAGNATSSGVTPDRMADAIKSLVGDKKLSFDTRTNKQSLENAASDIRTRGEETVKSELGDHAKNGIIADGDVEKALVLYAKYANDPEYQDTASEVFINMAAVANMSGRNLQLFSLMKRMTPEGQLMAVRKNVGRYIDSINNNRSGRKQITYNPGQANMDAARAVANKRNVTIDESLEQDFVNAKTEEQKKAALDNIYKNVAVQIKPTLGEAWDAWRNLAMLGNVKTHVRNMGSTAAFQPYVEIKRNIGAVLEKAFVKQENRTKAVLGLDRQSAELLNWAAADAKDPETKKLLGGSSSAGDEARNAIQDYRKILPGVLDTARKKNTALMEAEDGIFKRGEYTRSLASFLKARGYTANQLRNEQVPKGVLDAARQYAINEAKKATFNDQNKLSDSLSKLNKIGERFGGSAYHIISKGIVPFLRTPLNVVKRAAEYNPLSLPKTLLHAKGDIDSGRKSASDVIDEISAGLTGTAAMALGAALAGGLIPGVELIGAIDDEDEIQEGAQEYSIRIGEKYYSVAWLAPAMIPLFIGANLHNKFSKLEDGADGWDAVQALVDVGTDALDPMLELSMLSSLSDIIEKIKYEEDPADMAVTAVLNAVTSYFTQGIPTIFGQIEQSTETEKSSTYVNTDNKVERMVKTAVADATKRLPGDAYQTTKLDEWGEPVKNDEDWMLRAFNALLNPFNTSTRKTDEITKELSRLNDVQTEDVTPPTPSKTLSYTDKQGNAHKDVRLTEEQYQTLARTQGQTAKKIIETMIDSEDYAALTDEQKAQVVENIYSYAQEEARKQALPKYYSEASAWMRELGDDAANGLIRRATLSTINSSVTNTVDNIENGWDVTPAAKQDLDSLYDAYAGMSKEAKKQILDDAISDTAKFLEIRSHGVRTDQYLDVVTDIKDQPLQTGYSQIRDAQTYRAIAESDTLSDVQKDYVMKAYMPDYDPNAKTVDRTELKYDYMIEEGYSRTEFATAYDIYSHEKTVGGKGTADRTRERMCQELGIKMSEAKMLYKLFGGYYKPWEE